MSFYDSRIRKTEKKERLKEELNDYKGWDEKEAMYRSVGIIIRLNKIGVTEINLKNQFLSGANLDNINLQKSNISYAKLVDTELKYSDLRNIDLFDSDLSGADLSSSKLSGADLRRAKLIGSNFSNAILIDVDLRNTTLSKSTDFSQCNLLGAKVSSINFFKSNLDILALKDVEQRYYIDPIVKIDPFDSEYYVIKERNS